MLHGKPVRWPVVFGLWLGQVQFLVRDTCISAWLWRLALLDALPDRRDTLLRIKAIKLEVTLVGVLLLVGLDYLSNSNSVLEFAVQ